MVSRRPDVFSELGSLGSPMNHRNDAFWMSIRLGTSSTFSSLEKVLRTRGEVVSGKAKPPGRARRGNQAGRIRTKGATENPIRGLLLTQTRSVSLAAGWASATGYLQSLYRKPPGGQVAEPESVVAVEDAANRAQALLQVGRVRLLHDLALLLRRVHDLARLQRDGDVVAVAEQVAGLERPQRHLVPGGLLLVGVARQQHPEAAMHGLHEARAVDDLDRDAAPLVGTAQEHQGGLGDCLAACLAPRRGQRLGAKARRRQPGAHVAVGRLRYHHHVRALLGQRLAERVGFEVALVAVGQ